MPLSTSENLTETSGCSSSPGASTKPSSRCPSRFAAGVVTEFLYEAVPGGVPASQSQAKHRSCNRRSSRAKSSLLQRRPLLPRPGPGSCRSSAAPTRPYLALSIARRPCATWSRRVSASQCYRVTHTRYHKAAWWCHIVPFGKPVPPARGADLPPRFRARTRSPSARPFAAECSAERRSRRAY